MSFAERVKQRQADEKAALEQDQRRRQQAQAIADKVPDAWQKATTALHATITKVNKEAAELGEKIKFRHQPLQQSGENHTAVLLYLNGQHATISQTAITVTYTGRVLVDHDELGVIEMSLDSIDATAWENVLTAIYEADVAKA